VITLLNVQLLNIFSAVTLIVFKTASIFQIFSEIFERRWVDWSQLSYIKNQFTKIRTKDTELSMQKLMTVMMMIFFLNSKRKKKSAMRSLLCLRKLLVKYLKLNELQTLNSSHIQLINFNSSVTFLYVWDTDKLKLKRDIYIFTIIKWLLCELIEKILLNWVQHSMCLNLKSIFF